MTKQIVVPKADRVNWTYVAKLTRFAREKYGPFDGSLESDLRRLRAFRFLRGWLPALPTEDINNLLGSGA